MTVEQQILALVCYVSVALIRKIAKRTRILTFDWGHWHALRDLAKPYWATLNDTKSYETETALCKTTQIVLGWPCSPVHFSVCRDIELVIGCKDIMHIRFGGVYKHCVWNPDEVSRVFSSHCQRHLLSHVVRKPRVLPVLTKEHVQPKLLTIGKEITFLIKIVSRFWKSD